MDMKTISVEKVTLNCGCGTDHPRLEKSMKLLEKISGMKPIKTLSKTRLANWGLRVGLPIGTKVTLRGKKAEDLLKRFLQAKDNRMSKRCFDESGNVSFGIHEYIDIPGVEYDPDIGVIGLQISTTLTRPGTRVKTRSNRPAKIGKRQLISKEDAMQFFVKNYGVTFIEDEAEDE